MAGFFKKPSKEQIPLFADSDIKSVKKRNKQGKDPCTVCGLFKKSNITNVGISGSGQKKILIIDGGDDGERLIGTYRVRLGQALQEYGLSLNKDFYVLGCIDCCPPRYKKPTKTEIKCCNHKITQLIRSVNPRFIWLMGSGAIESFYHNRFRNCSVDRWRHRCIPDCMYNAWVIPMYHPAALSAEKNSKNIESIYRRDLKWAVSCLKRGPFTYEDEFKNVHCLTKFDDVVDILTQIKKDRLRHVFDYETTSISPFVTGSMIWSISVATSNEAAYSFPYQYSHWNPEQFKQIRSIWKRILYDPEIQKIAQNLKFEDIWSYKICGVNVRGWVWDTLIATHIFEEQNHGTKLEFQAYTRYGIEPYDAVVNPYKKSKGNAQLNRLGELPLEILLKYGGADSLVAHKIYDDQVMESKRYPDLTRAFLFFLGGLEVFSDMQKEGICIDEDYFEKEGKRLAELIKNTGLGLMQSYDNKVFKSRYGRDVNLKSNPDLSKILFDIGGLEPIKKTAKGANCTDKTVLMELDTPFTRKLLHLKKLIKIKDTYLAQYNRIAYNGKLYPFFDLNTTRTYRSSSSHPNFQNVPKRDKEAKNAVRRGIIASDEHKLLEWDYSSAEVRIAACYTKDPVLVKYLHDPTSDMHTDEACEIFALKEDQITKTIRYEIKSGFVFAEFYGSYYKACARNMYDTCFDLKTKDDMTIRQHLKKAGIIGKKQTEYRDFEAHVQKHEEKFWCKYNVFKKWQRNLISFYQKRGYIKTFFGHRRGGILSNNQIINTPIQAAAFHCLLWSLIQINKIRKAEKWNTKIIGQIHDAGVYDLDPQEQEQVIRTTYDISCKKLRERFDWLIVPMDLEIDIADIGKSWADKEPFDFKKEYSIS